MESFCRDVDLLKWEPMLFGDLAPAGQTLARGDNGVLAGTVFTDDNADFVGRGVKAGHVICLSNNDFTLDGVYEIVSVDFQSQLGVSIVRPRELDTPIAPPAGSEIEYRISTFDPQSQEASLGLLRYFGLSIDEETGEISETILNHQTLRQAAVFSVLAAVLAANAGEQNKTCIFWQKSQRYQKMYESARTQARLEIDTNADRLMDKIQTGGTVQLRRM
ncbi:MAG: hypothetical protein JW860_08345 [Sedimentisphaerales bacterium]|nr:hypothetical protein [Sedimentisphaerales bacterium]